MTDQPSARDRLHATLAEVEADAYRRGLAAGLGVAERITVWLQHLPASRRRDDVIAWAEAAIAGERK